VVADSVSKDAILQAYLTEYQQCMESYRHTYQTIWQVGSIFAAITGGLFAFTGEAEGLPPGQVFAPVPLLFWYVGVFLPMDQYGEVRRKRLVALEEFMNKEWNLGLSHYRDLDCQIDRRTLFWNVRWPLRVSHAVHALAVGLVALILFLLPKMNA
jgi:hypothetical protein